jgi:hypothetical protein
MTVLLLKPSANPGEVVNAINYNANDWKRVEKSDQEEIDLFKKQQKEWATASVGGEARKWADDGYASYTKRLANDIESERDAENRARQITGPIPIDLAYRTIKATATYPKLLFSGFAKVAADCSIANCHTDANGKFGFANQPVGKYYLYAISEGDDFGID